MVGGRWLREEFSADGPQTLPIAPSYLEANQNIMVIDWTCKIRTEPSFKPQAVTSFTGQDPVTQAQPTPSLKCGLHLTMLRLNVTSK